MVFNSYVVLGFLGLMGFFHLSVLWVGLPLCQATGLEVVQLPANAALTALLTSGAIALVVNTLYMLVIHICSPLFISVGMALTVPSTYVLDLIVGHIVGVKFSTAFGVAINTAGFVALALAPGSLSEAQQAQQAEAAASRWHAQAEGGCRAEAGGAEAQLVSARRSRLLQL